MDSGRKHIENKVNEPELAYYELVNGLGIINSALPQIRSICKKYNVEYLVLFGSALKGPFTDKSDIDFLVKFYQIPLEDYFENYINLKLELEHLLGRKVDLLEQQTLQNPYLIQSIDQNKLRIYGK